ncbi:C4-dicarboxylate ABC transporter substrate-binding protein [Cereibacter changlensis]|uniref:C4-dicarboxylate ABC transporter substrate-binding protein n=1 Tax=Cereibacter changlensis TaxID=402884 RepID=A0A4U0Z593_9RHOB|nr:C4-dicarboxylate TRAP transporter substrate-binding protein [Cereibacter changlensis]TKA98446.1 C4-dicarboxylate ABC transporter substrate-binding protein [Cereibacter changlensis]
MIKTTRRTFLTASGSALALPFLGRRVGATEVIDIQIGSSHPTTNIWAHAMQAALQPEVDRLLAEKGAYSVRWHENYGGTLYKFTDTRTAVRDGIVDIGMVGTLWEGSAMPLQNITYYTPFANDDHMAVIDIFDGLTETLPELKDSWTAQNMQHLSSLITDSYGIYANFPITSVADVANRRLSAPGSSANWLAGTGATPVDGALTTYYTDIQTGVSEGTLSFASGIQPTRVYEVAPHLARVGFGAMYFGGIAANLDFMARLPPEVAEAIVTAGKHTSAAHGAYVTERSNAALSEMQAAGLQTVDFDAAARTEWAATLPNIVQPWVEANGEPGLKVLHAYFDALAARGLTPARDWTSGL